VTACEVFAANEVEVRLQEGGGFSPTPVISHAILSHNRGRRTGLADGVILTPSHNPPADGGYKYNPPTGGPAGSEVTRDIEARANRILEDGLHAVRALPLERALAAGTTKEEDFQGAYIRDLSEAIDLEAIREAGLRIGVDPMGGAAVGLWDPLAERYGIRVEVVNRKVDPTFSFMAVDHDGKIRMDCSSPHAMAGLIALRDRFDIAFGNDPDTDRHGIVTPGGGLMNPNAYLSAAIGYLFRNRPGWRETSGVGKTLVSSSMIDRVTKELGRTLVEVPVGFKWFVDGLLDGSLGFGGEESAGASFLRRDGRAWTTDKDGILLDLLAAEITAKTGRDPSRHYQELEERFGRPVYRRIDAPATPAQKAVLLDLTPESIEVKELAGETILEKFTRAPGNGAAVGGLKVVAENGWFAARPSGTENVYKVYAESFKGEEHLARIQEEAQAMVDAAFRKAGA
jgi:phosphoglucomutase